MLPPLFSIAARRREPLMTGPWGGSEGRGREDGRSGGDVEQRSAAEPGERGAREERGAALMRLGGLREAAESGEEAREGAVGSGGGGEEAALCCFSRAAVRDGGDCLGCGHAGGNRRRGLRSNKARREASEGAVAVADNAVPVLLG